MTIVDGTRAVPTFIRLRDKYISCKEESSTLELPDIWDNRVINNSLDRWSIDMSVHDNCDSCDSCEGWSINVSVCDNYVVYYDQCRYVAMTCVTTMIAIIAMTR